MSSTEKTVIVIPNPEVNQDDEGDNQKQTTRNSLRKPSFVPNIPSDTQRRSSSTSRKQSLAPSEHSRRRSSSRSKHRRSTYGFGMRSKGNSVGGLSNQSLGLEFRRPNRKYLNTYQLEPRKPFDSIKVTKVIMDTLRELFSNHVYHPNYSPSLALILAGEIKCKVQSLKYDRYRIITLVTIGQRKYQSYNNAVAFIWDHTRDGYANYSMKVHTAFIQATVFGIYLD